MRVDFHSVVGKIKPMHATNNGPAVTVYTYEDGSFEPYDSYKIDNAPPNMVQHTNLNEFKQAGIPYARNHDASFYYRYGGDHTVDVAYIFRDFDADPTDPDNYDFACTDHYIKGCVLADTEVFYRLGHRIEHEIKKYGTLPPKDFHKWAVICEHIIRHYTEGWANGFRFKMEYWEIWNEPDLHWNDGKVSPTWGGTFEQFCEFYDVAATHLKKCFPHLKIGGPACSGSMVWTEKFLSQLKAPLDFYSWHCYAPTTKAVMDKAQKVRGFLDQYGYPEAESILNEWNYVQAWRGDDYIYSQEQHAKIKGAAFVAATMSAAQRGSIDMLMYYDARPGTPWNGMFSSLPMGKVLKAYYPFPMFNTLYQLGNCVETITEDEGGYLCAARNGDEAAVLLTHFNNDDSTEAKNFSIDLVGFGDENGTEIEFYLLDETHDCTFVGKSTYYGDRFSIELPMPNFTSYLLKIKKKQLN